MLVMSDLKYKLKGSESFTIREGWLNKGLMAIKKNESVFTEKNAMDILGVGSKMVKSIRYWLLATGLCYESKKGGGKVKFVLTEDLGVIVDQYDKYFEDIFTLWILHFNLVRRREFCTVWNLFFNNFNVTDFMKIDMVNKIFDEFTKLYNKDNSLYNAISDDCSGVLKMYSVTNDDINADPEDNLCSPFSELCLIRKNSNEKNSYSKTKPVYEKLDKLVVLYIILSNMEDDKKSVDIDTLITQDNNIGKVLNLDRVMINEYLDQLRQAGMITINRTAGLDMIYVNENLTPKDVLMKYYNPDEY